MLLVVGVLRTKCQSQAAAPSVYYKAWVTGVPRLAALGVGLASSPEPSWVEP